MAERIMRGRDEKKKRKTLWKVSQVRTVDACKYRNEAQMKVPRYWWLVGYVPGRGGSELTETKT